MNRRYLFSFFLIILLLLPTHHLLFASENVVSLSLHEAINMALENNLHLKLQKTDLSAAHGGKQAQEGTFDTIVTAGAFNENKQLTSIVPGGASEEDIQAWNASIRKKMYTGTEMDLSWQNQRYDSNASYQMYDPAYQSEISIGVSQPLLKGRGKQIQTADIQSSEKIIRAAASLVDSGAVDLAADVKKAYWELLYTRYDIEVKRLSLQLAQQIVNDTKNKINAGAIASVEIYRPESEVARREEYLINAERMQADAEDNLKLLLNRVEWDAILKTEELPVMTQDVPELQTVIDYVLKNHPDIKASEFRMQAAQLNVYKAEDSLQPDISLSGRAGVNGADDKYGDSAGNMVSDSDFSWKIGLSFSMSLENDLAQGTKIISQAELNKIRLNHELLMQQFILQAKGIVRNFRLVLKSIDASEKTVLAAQKNLETEQEKFTAGLSTSLDILLAQEAYTQALAGQKRSQVTYANILAELDRIKGIITSI